MLFLLYKQRGAILRGGSGQFANHGFSFLITYKACETGAMLPFSRQHLKKTEQG
jgi:hypothetical protein